MTEANKLFCGDALEVLKTFDDNSIDSMVTDPPAGIGFMGKEWDHHKGGRDEWIKWLRSIMEEALRVLKPGGHGLVWALPRTSHWTATALEDAGFEIRDCIYHVFGSGFPKSLNVGKSVDRLQGNEREVTGTQMLGGNAAQTTKEKGGTYASNTDSIGVKPIEVQLTKGSSDWEGWGTALKPAVECWWLVRKPLEESTVAKNVLEYGTGALNIDAARVELSDGADLARENKIDNGMYGIGNNNNNAQQRKEQGLAPQGRWPSHLIHDGSDEVLEHFPQTTSGTLAPHHLLRESENNAMSGKNYERNPPDLPGNSGSAARFFYCAKPSKRERNEGLDGFDQKDGGCLVGNNIETQNPGNKIGANPEKECLPTKNNHPTVKAQSLMRYLITLITPPEGIVLDMFMGSGSTGVACKSLGFNFVGIELDPEYLEIARARIDHTQKEAVVEQLDLLGEE